MVLKLTKFPVMLILTVVIFTVHVTLSAVPAQASHLQWAKTVHSGKKKTTTLAFYFHDIVRGKNTSTVTLVEGSKATRSTTNFGALKIADDLLTVGPEPTSKPVGRAQGMYGMANREELGLIMAFSYSFTTGKYNGSSITILGRNSVMHPVRELPVVGGTGVFRMARGVRLRTNPFV